MNKSFSYTFQRRPSVRTRSILSFSFNFNFTINGKKKSSRAAFLFLLIYLNSRKNRKCTKTLMEKKKKKKCASYPQIPNNAISRKKKTKPSIATGRSDENLSELSRRAASLRLNCCIAGGGERRCRRGGGEGQQAESFEGALK